MGWSEADEEQALYGESEYGRRCAAGISAVYSVFPNKRSEDSITHPDFPLCRPLGRLGRLGGRRLFTPNGHG